VLEDGDVEVALFDRQGDVLLGRPSARTVSLDAGRTGLPWQIGVADGDPTRARRAGWSRRWFTATGLLVVGVIIVGSGVLTFRGIRREMAIAKMHADFVSAASHEFRTPLTSIRQLAHMLQSGRVESDGRRAQYYDVLVRESERLHRLVERLLKFGRADAGRLHRERLDAREIGTTVASDFARRAGGDSHRVTTAAHACPIQGDRELLSLALWNLLDNAVKYSPPAAAVDLDITATDGQVRLAVRDRGAGIAATDQRRVFEQFVRGADVPSGTAGSGLGLALVDRVVKAHGGRVDLDSAAGAGSVFTIILPAERPS
jgi:signal transduction histidine kinase